MYSKSDTLTINAAREVNCGATWLDFIGTFKEFNLKNNSTIISKKRKFKKHRHLHAGKTFAASKTLSFVKIMQMQVFNPVGNARVADLAPVMLFLNEYFLAIFLSCVSANRNILG